MPTAKVFVNGGEIGSGQGYNTRDILNNYFSQQQGGGQGDAMGGYYGGAYGAAGQRLDGGGGGGYTPNPSINYGASGGGSGFGGGGGGPSQGIMDLLNTQKADNMWARNNNEKNWNMARDGLNSVKTDYWNSPVANQARGMTQNMMSNPEAINDRVQQLIQNRAAGQIDAASNAQERSIRGQMASAGQMDSGSIAAMRERMGRTNLAQRAGMDSNLTVQRANQRNQDMYNAIGAGQRQAGQDTGVNMGVASTMIQNLPQYRADNYSGWIAALQGNQGGAGGFGGGMGPGGSQSSGADPYGIGKFSMGKMNGGGANNGNDMFQNWQMQDPFASDGGMNGAQGAQQRRNIQLAQNPQMGSKNGKSNFTIPTLSQDEMSDSYWGF